MGELKPELPNTEPQITEDVKSALEAAGESAHRCRAVSLALVTASVLAFMAWWNSVSWSWIHVRETRLDEAVSYWNETNPVMHNKIVNFIAVK
jgi:hypothetical protein